ncbi:hypothetical protein ABW21_db0208516 [Orbilia brochopaga]|nr:hypothetical protein ABW21_db0208516 [Drechslerella brochopaga]
MADEGSRSPAEAGIRKRKVRKGTQSCWQCKRRKIKCTFAASADATCQDCKRRGTPCISQELPEDVGGNPKQVGDRLGRVEELVGQLLRDTQQRTVQRPSHPGARTPLHQVAPSDTLLGLSDATAGNDIINTGREATSDNTYDDLSRSLLDAWPAQQDFDLILSANTESLVLFHGLICKPYSEFLRHQMPSPREMLQKPQPRSHPVLIAQKLLMLGIFLQGCSTSNTNQLAGLSTGLCDMKHRAVEMAARLVTSNDKFSGTVEMVECVIMESMYRNNAGDLRLAYLAMRRALAMSQMVALWRGYSSPLLRSLDPSTLRRIDPERLWFRIIQSDRYLSLMLGLPQGTSDESFASAEGFENYTAMERLERLDCLASGRIIQRNCADIPNLQTTQEIDQLLQNAAASVPSQWWLIPDPLVEANNGRESVHAANILRLMNQLTHYHLLQRLHLPYLLHPSADCKYHNSRITAIASSRELLSRFVSFRSSRAASSFCRGIDFLAFIATTALCLAHILVHCHHQGPAAEESCGFLGFLMHQRPSDRALMERALESLECAAQFDADSIATKIASINRRLLAIEADAAMGGIYKTDSSYTTDNEELECSGKIADNGETLQIHIPHIGNISFKQFLATGNNTTAAFSARSATPKTYEQPVDNIEFLDGDFDLQGVELAFFDNLFRFCDQ